MNNKEVVKEARKKISSGMLRYVLQNDNWDEKVISKIVDWASRGAGI